MTMKYLSIAALIFVGAMMTGCSSDSEDFINSNQPELHADKVVTLTTTISRDETQTRALTENGVKTFQAGEEIAVVYDKTDNTNARVVATLTAGDITNNGKSARITVTMTNPKTGGAVKYVYPASMALGEYGEQGFENTDAIFYEQNGTLSGIESYVDYAKFEGTFNGTELPSGTLRNQLAICKFTIKDGNGTDITSQVTKLTIKNGQNVYYINTTQQEKIWVALKPITSDKIDIYAAKGWALHRKTVTSNTTLAANTLTPITVTAPQVPGALSGLFSINANNDLAYFSWGNLQTSYNSTDKWNNWKFADYQHEFVGKETIKITYPDEGEKIDLFGRSSWTHPAGSNNYGIDESNDESDYYGDFLDWSEVDIKNGGGRNKWHTPSFDEMHTILYDRYCRVPLAGKLCPRYMKAYFPPDNNGIQIAGVVLFPDHFVPPALTKTFISESDINEPNTVGVMLDWEEWDEMEKAGAVFLPCAGLREKEHVYLRPFEYPAGRYWTSANGNGTYGGQCLEMGKRENGDYFFGINTYTRSYGYSVRLIGPGSANQ